ncbi:MAG: hypothetical protein IT532_09870 [Burkholderiales bacterium]|nr:hypothetical protein [Burkholderiales bacterium]
MTRRLAAWLVAACIAALPSRAPAHDLIDAQGAERYLLRIEREQDVLHSKASPTARAQASVALGSTLDEIRDLLNRDIASHGQPQGLPTLFLIQSLRSRGLALEISPALGCYPANLGFYRSALRLDPDGPGAGEARLRLLQGHFYDSFGQDPLQPRDQSWAMLQEQIRHAEILLRASPAEPNREEVLFILAVHHLQAARAAPDAGARGVHAKQARETIAQFRSRYPDSLRVAALDVLGEGLAR